MNYYRSNCFRGMVVSESTSTDFSGVIQKTTTTVDNVEHTFFDCVEWQKLRTDAEKLIGKLAPQTLVGKMLSLKSGRLADNDDTKDEGFNQKERYIELTVKGCPKIQWWSSSEVMPQQFRREVSDTLLDRSFLVENNPTYAGDTSRGNIFPLSRKTINYNIKKII